MIESVPVPIFIADENGTYAYVNKAYTELTGYSKEELLQKGIPELSKNPDKAVKYFENLKKDGEINVELELESNSGETLEVILSGVRMSNDRYFACCHDISELKNAYSKLEALKKETEVANEAKTEFMNNVSHELRTPLSGIRGTLELLRIADSKEEMNELIEMAESSCKRLTETLSDIVDLIRLYREEEERLYENVPTKKIETDMYELFKTNAYQKGLELSIDTSDRVPEEMVLDKNKTYKILTNLLANSIKFTESGYVNLHIDYLNKHGNDRVLFSVMDSGKGIEDEMLNRAFQRFSQVYDGKNYMNKNVAGMGLGLSVVKEATKSLNGSLSVESNGGSCFYVCLPLMKYKQEYS